MLCFHIIKLYMLVTCLNEKIRASKRMCSFLLNAHKVNVQRPVTLCFFSVSSYFRIQMILKHSVDIVCLYEQSPRRHGWPLFPPPAGLLGQVLSCLSSASQHTSLPLPEQHGPLPPLHWLSLSPVRHCERPVFSHTALCLLHVFPA